MSNLDMYNTITNYADRFAHLADMAYNNGDYKLRYDYNQMFHHYYKLARNFNINWQLYKVRWGLA